MGLFVLGVLVGWLAEWLFFTFWVNDGSKNSSSDCSELSAQLNAKNKEIDSLMASLSEAKKNKPASKAESVATTTPATSSTKKATKPAAKKAPAKKATAVKSDTATKSSETKKAAPKKTAAKKASVKKSTPAKKTTAKKSTGDDLTKLSGIGPSMAATMAELGITSYKKLAAMDDDILRDMLEASGARLNNNKEAMDSWNEQATLAGSGDFAGLKKLQDDLKK
jgi:predicted flap endonuclease-1-like 5' DNA nuclease